MNLEETVRKARADHQNMDARIKAYVEQHRCTALKRKIIFVPGYDHRDHEDPQKRSRHGMDLLFCLYGPAGAVSLQVFTHWLPSVADLEHPTNFITYPYGVGIDFHYLTGSRLSEHREPSRDCLVLKDLPCYHMHISSMAASKLFARFLKDGEEVVWAELEDYYATYGA